MTALPLLTLPTGRYRRLECLSVREVLDCVDVRPLPNGMHVNGKRMRIYKRDNATCQVCGKKASFFAVELTPGSGKRHLALYTRECNRDMPMTIDHIVPLAIGGSSYPDNLRTCCWKCNNRKSGSDQELAAWLQAANRAADI